MSAPRKSRAPADSSDRQELEDLLRSAAKFFEANKPPLTRQPRRLPSVKAFDAEVALRVAGMDIQ